MSEAFVAGEEPESDTDDEEVAVPAGIVTAVAGEEPESDTDDDDDNGGRPPASSAVAGEETESSDDDEDDGESNSGSSGKGKGQSGKAASDGAAALDQGHGGVGNKGASVTKNKVKQGPEAGTQGFSIPPAEFVDNASTSPASPSANKDGSRRGSLFGRAASGSPRNKPSSTRHKRLREHNISFRKGLMNKACGTVRHVSSTLSTTGVRTSKTQMMAQDISDQLRVLVDDLQVLDKKFSTFLCDDVIPKVFIPSLSIVCSAGSSAESLKPRVSEHLMRQSLPEGTTSDWQPNDTIKIEFDNGGYVEYRLRPAKDRESFEVVEVGRSAAARYKSAVAHVETALAACVADMALTAVPPAQ
eukprot:m.25000 g.25000  ORF g.25000 m.25000 type:complete len:358 (+) comp7695_c0_seq2:73-1146(+)